MRVIQVHNFYRSSAPSGEDEVVRSERALMLAAGIEVMPFERCNDALGPTLSAAIASASSYVWSSSAREDLAQMVRLFKPDVVHFHNLFPQISPAAYAACTSAKVPVVQTLHNFRLFCANGLLQRDGQPCEKCVGRYPAPALRYGCYRNSRVATAGIALALTTHRALGTHARHVTRFIALTDFAARKFVEAGLPADRIIVRGNSLATDPGVGSGRGGYALFVGRLTAEKGAVTLLKAWAQLSGVPLKIVGDGERRAELEQLARGLPVQFLGRQSSREVIEAMQEAEVLVIPSECYEGFPRVFVEGLATGTPIVAADLGGLGELVSSSNGVKFVAGNADSLATTVRSLLEQPGLLQQMRAENRRRYLAEFGPERAIQSLVAAYDEAQRAQR